MRAMVLSAPETSLQKRECAHPGPGAKIRVNISACGVRRNDLHIVDAKLPNIRYPFVPGHEIVGRVECAAVLPPEGSARA